MDVSDIEQSNSVADEVATLTRNRSFKTKHLVRSQALRESQSPPRAMSPSQLKVTKTLTEVMGSDRTLCDDVSSHVNECHSVFSDSCNNNNGDSCEDLKKGPVEIQITSGEWESEVAEMSEVLPAPPSGRWSGRRGLFAREPRVTCVCVVLAETPRCDYCRVRRPKLGCSSKQDSGIVCSDECPECSDCEINESSPPIPTKCDSVEADTDEQTSCRCSERKEIPKNTCLVRGDSDDRYEPTGMDLVNFIKETLNKNPKDRMTLLKIEKELHTLVADPGRFLVRFPVMSSYGRMLVHRCAALFELSHNIDVYNKCAVVVSKNGTSGGCIPCTNFEAWCTTDFPPINVTHETQTKFILKRDAHSLDDTNSNGGIGNSLRSKSLEQREKEYEKVRRRIFSTDNCHPDDGNWWCGNGPVKLYTDNGKSKLIKVQSLETSTPTASCRGAVAKSHSFGGYEPPPTRLLSRQGDLALSSWRLSPSSSGYKTLSLRSTDSITPSPTGGVSPEPSAQNNERSLMWAITEMASVPEGSLIIHPNTCQPLRNPDGSVYHYDPTNPPVIDNVNDEDKCDPNSEKKRGRLEKQHCFVDTEYDCQIGNCSNDKFVNLDWTEDVAAEYKNSPQYQDGETEITQQMERLSTNETAQPPADEVHEQPCEVVVNQEVATQEEPQQEPEQNGANCQEEGAKGETTCPPEKAQPPPQQEARGKGQTASAAVSYQTSAPPPLQYSAVPNQHTYPPSNCRSEPAIRIDATYPHYAEIPPGYVPAQYIPPYHHPHIPTCPGCPIDQLTGIAHCRGYQLAYGQQFDPAAMLAHTYPVGNVLLAQQSVPSFSYPPPPLWHRNMQQILTPGLPSNCPTPAQKPTSPPNLYLPTQEVPIFHPAQVNYNKQHDIVNYPPSQVYPVVQYPYTNYPVVGPVVPPYQYCQQLYPVTDKPDLARNRNVRSFENMQPYNSQVNSTSNSSRATPVGSTPPAQEVKATGNRSISQYPAVPADDADVQQLREHMAHMSMTAETRNKDPGILGSYPQSRYYNYHRADLDEARLPTAARAVVDSIRNLPQKTNNNNYYRRNDNFQRNPFRQNRSYDGYQRRDGRRGDDHGRFGAKGSQEKAENAVNPNQQQLAPKQQHNAHAAQPHPPNGQARFDHQQSRNRNGNFTYYGSSNAFRQVPGWPRRSTAPQPGFTHQRRPPQDKRTY